MNIDMIEEDEGRRELRVARLNIKSDLKKGIISKARYVREMQITNDHEAHMDAMDCAYSDDC